MFSVCWFHTFRIWVVRLCRTIMMLKWNDKILIHNVQWELGNAFFPLHLQCTVFGVQIQQQQNITENFNYYFGLAHKTHSLDKLSPCKFMPNKLEHFPKSTIVSNIPSPLGSVACYLIVLSTLQAIHFLFFNLKIKLNENRTNKCLLDREFAVTHTIFSPKLFAKLVLKYMLESMPKNIGTQTSQFVWWYSLSTTQTKRTCLFSIFYFLFLLNHQWYSITLLLKAYHKCISSSIFR